MTDMKATLEYDLPDEQEEFQDAVNGSKWKYAMWKLDNELRSLIKYAPDSMPDMEHETYKKIRTTLHRILNENELNL